MPTDTLRQQALDAIAACKENGRKIAVAESCTGGLVAAELTEIPGASAVFDRGFITYSNEAKSQMLGVDAALIAQYGAVSRQVAEAMAKGALAHSAADVAVAITGIAGPDGGTGEKPVGLVYIAKATKNNIMAEECRFSGDRRGIRQNAAARALELLITP